MKFKVENVRGLSLYVNEAAYLESAKGIFHKTTEETFVKDVKDWLYDNIIKESGFHYSTKTWLLSPKTKKEGPIVVSAIVSVLNPEGTRKNVKGTVVVTFKYSLFKRIKRWFAKKYSSFIDKLANM